MPEQLKVHPGERVDLVDYVHGSNTYTSEAQKHLLERLVLDRRSRILEGFRVRVEDQTVNPGMITVFNGTAMDRDGQIIHNEQVIDDSRSVTLLGANLNFYVEIEFTSVESATDARFFWDPTTPNTAPIPPGSEFPLNVATRITPDWRIVTPVSTTGFTQTTSPDAIRIPVGVFRTDGSNQIAPGVANPGLSLVTAASVIERDVSAGSTALRVLDARMFPSTLPFSILIQAQLVTETHSVVALDREHGILTLSAPLAWTHRAGVIVRVTGGTANLVADRTDPSDPALDPNLAIPGHPDPAQRLFQADELRGSALMASRETFGARDDLNVRCLKDEIDFLAAQIRELKFGSPRPDTINSSPPSTFAARPRYYDRAGSVTGARTNTVSIGNGTTSFGDINDPDASQALFYALGLLPASGGTIFVKNGTYTFNTAVSINRPVRFVFESGGAQFMNADVGPMFLVSQPVVFENGYLHGGTSNVVMTVNNTSVTFDRCTVYGSVSVNTGSVNATDTIFEHLGGIPCINNVSGTLSSSTFVDCVFTNPSGAACLLGTCTTVKFIGCASPSCSRFLHIGATSDLSLEYCTVVASAGLLRSSAMNTNVFRLRVKNCTIVAFNTPTIFGVLDLTEVNTVTDVSVTDTSVALSSVSDSSYANPCAIVQIYGSNVSRIKLHNVYAFAPAAISGPICDGVRLDSISSAVDDITVTACSMVGIRHAIVLSPLNTSVGGTVVVDGLLHDNNATHSGDVTGIRLGTSSSSYRLTVTNSVFRNYNDAGSGTRAGIALNSVAVAPCMLTVQNCKFLNIGIPASGVTAAYGVQAEVDTAASISHYHDISGNTMLDIAGDSRCSGVSIRNLNATGGAQRISIRDNVIRNIGNIDAPLGFATGIFVGNNQTTVGTFTHILDNHVGAIYGTTRVSGVELESCGQALISGNNIGSIINANDSAADGGAGIRIAAGSTARGLRIVDNYLWPGSSSRYGIVISTLNLTRFAIRNNVIVTSTSATGGGIYIQSQSVQQGHVCDNVIEFADDVATSERAALTMLLSGTCHTLAVDGNLITELYNSAASEYHQGIRISATGTARALSVSNNVLVGNKDPGPLRTGLVRIGINVQTVARTKIVGNIVDWNEPARVRGQGIFLGATAPVAGHVVTSNYVRSDDFADPGFHEINISGAAATHGILDSNQVGEGALVGTISPADLSWTYGTNKTA